MPKEPTRVIQKEPFEEKLEKLAPIIEDTEALTRRFAKRRTITFLYNTCEK